MIDFFRSLFETAFSFPSVILTVMLGLVLLYWIFSSLTGAGGEVDGAAEGLMESLVDGVAESALEGVADGLVEGVAEGALEGVAEGAMEGAAEGVVDGAAEGAGEMATWSALGRLFGCLGLTAVPVTLFLSMLVLFSWLLSLAISHLLGIKIGVGSTSMAVGLGVLAAAFTLGLVATALVVRPLRPFFYSPHLPARRDLVGSVVTVRTLIVDARFGQAEYADGEAGLLLDVRCNQPNKLTRGDVVKIARYDRAEDVYLLDPQPAAAQHEPPLPGDAVASHSGCKPVERDEQDDSEPV